MKKSDAYFLLLLASFDDSQANLITFGPGVQEYEYQIVALEDEVRQAQYLPIHQKTAQASQLQLLMQWTLNGD